jgi:nucleoside-diphosphate-sugar epimerase
MTDSPFGPPRPCRGGDRFPRGKVVDELLKRGKSVRALVRSTTDASRLQTRCVEIARGDMLDLDSLLAARHGADAVITTAAGYTRGGKNAQDIDTSATPTSPRPPTGPLSGGSS